MEVLTALALVAFVNWSIMKVSELLVSKLKWVQRLLLVLPTGWCPALGFTKEWMISLYS